MEQLDVTRATAIQAILHRHIVDEGLRLTVVDVLAGRDPSTQHDPDPVVVEPFGEAERVVRTGATPFTAVVVGVHAEADVHRLQGTARDVVDLALQEAGQSIAHIDIHLARSRRSS